MARRLVKPLVAAAVIVVALTTASMSGAGHQNRTLVFGASADPRILDPILVSDGESLRPIRQIFEGLMTVVPGTARVAPQLARTYRSSNRGRTWTFTLRRGVTFHDGTQFNAAAVCFNFNRWYNFTGAFQNAAATAYWQAIFGGFRSTVGKADAPAAQRTSLFRSCRAVSRYVVQINLTRPAASFLGALSLPSFSFSSPRALRQYEADKAELRSGVPVYTGSYGFSHPTGTGPFRFGSWRRGEQLTIVRYARYWGGKAHLARIILRPIPTNAGRLQALQTGEVQGYDLVDPQDMPTISRNSNLRLLNRAAFNVAYVAFNQAKAPMNRLAVRQAVAHGLDRAAVVNSSIYAGRGQVAHAFMPPGLAGYAANVTRYPFNPARSQQLLRQAGLTLPVKIEFWYPSGVQRPYMPDPPRIFQAFAASLERSGFEVEAKSAPWSPDYLGAAQTGQAGHLHLLGWTGDYADADNFLGEFFQAPKPQWGFNNPAIHNLLTRAEAEPNARRRVALYQDANRRLMQLLPGVPYAHTRPALGFQRAVRGYIPSPVSLEPFRLVFYSGGA
jgi:peptide/nickel transport system substrate-binding protein